ncbi:RND transporter [Sphingomonas prati]|uniref:efflux transporter outer membrane subunit n=1 Tax=Sphingomonas prati TaxID=1843237 RepID=UPI0016097B70|nr:efflux transporter outer membrane subunit [Sphingomonas prati]GGE85344.1 RND transporter [Sphingomonas prati]
MAIAAALLVSGCMTGTDYVRPDVMVADRWRASAMTGEAPLTPWWNRVGDPQLQALITAALAQNLDIEIVLARLDRARAAVGATQAALRPGGGVQSSVSRTRASNETGLASIADQVPGIRIDRSESVYDATLRASWEADLFGGLRRSREAAGQDYQAAFADGAAARIAIAAEVADTYVQLRTLQVRLDVATALTRSAERLETLVRQRYAAGEASLRELEQARTSSAAIRATLPGLRFGIEVRLNRIMVLAGTVPEADRNGLDQPGPVPTMPLPSSGSPRDLLRRRPDIVAAERRLAASHARIGQALAEYYPSVSLSALAGFQSTAAGRLLSGPASVVGGTFGLRWRLFDFERIAAEVAAARGVEREALAGYRQLVLRAAEDVENAAVAYGSAKERVATHAVEVEAATRARQLLDEAWRAGQIGLLDLIEADRRLLQARDSVANASGDAARAVIALNRTLG